jgi:hypothetical protein
MARAKMTRAKITGAKWITSITLGGVALGAMLAAATEPQLKPVAPQWWQHSGREAIATTPDPELFAEALIERAPADSYRPDLDYEAEVWALPLPDADFAALNPPPDPHPKLRPEEVEPAAAEVPASPALPEPLADGIY